MTKKNVTLQNHQGELLGHAMVQTSDCPTKCIHTQPGPQCRFFTLVYLVFTFCLRAEIFGWNQERL